MSSNVRKRCDCGEAKWPKCGDAWYMVPFQWRGVTFAPNVSRYAREHQIAEPKTKTEAETLARAIRTAIEAGTYVSAKAKRRAAQPTPVVAAPSPTTTTSGTTPPTAQEVFDGFERDGVTCGGFKCDEIDTGDQARDDTRARMVSCLKTFLAFVLAHGGVIGAKLITDVAFEDLLAFKLALRANGKPVANSTWAKYRTVLGQFFDYAVEKKLLDATPFARAGKKKSKKLRRGQMAKRERRVTPELEAKLLAAAALAHGKEAAARLIAMIIAAIECGLRRGELLALQVRDVHLQDGWIKVRGEEEGGAKGAKKRDVPISARLRPIVAARLLDPNGEELGPKKYVFGDAVGGRVKSITKAWLTCVLRAHGHEPVWVDNGKLGPTSRAVLDEIDLHFHDLRHEFGSRWEALGVRPTAIQGAYGHATLAQTSTYLNLRKGELRDAIAVVDAAATAPTPTPAAPQPADVPSRYKRRTNATTADAVAHGLRLVSGAKSRRAV